MAPSLLGSQLEGGTNRRGRYWREDPLGKDLKWDRSVTYLSWVSQSLALTCPLRVLAGTTFPLL